MNQDLIQSITSVSEKLNEFRKTCHASSEVDAKALTKSIEIVAKLAISTVDDRAKVSSKDLVRSVCDLSSLLMSSFPVPEGKEKDPNKTSIMRALRKWSDENLHSDFIAALLDPDRSGPAAFRLFYELAALSTKKPPSISPDASWQSVHREMRLDEIDRTLVGGDEKGARRIDIIALRTDAILVIENKVFTWESEGQTTDYAEAVSRGYDKSIPPHKRFFIMLSPVGKPGAAEEFSGVSYYQFLMLLDNIIDSGENADNDFFVFYRNELMSTILRSQIETYRYSKEHMGVSGNEFQRKIF